MANKLTLNFSGGMNSKDSPLTLKENESELIINYNLEDVGSLVKRPGYELLGTNSLSTSGLFGTMNPNNKDNQAYLTVNDGTPNRITYYLKSSDNTWTTTNDTGQTPFLPAGASNQVFRTRFVAALNYIFRINGGDAPVSFLITTPQTKTTVNLKYEDAAAIAITPFLGAVYQDRIYFNDSADGKRSRLYYSTEITAAGTVTWGASVAGNTQFFDVNVDDGDFITALENNGNHLLVFKNYAMYRWIWGQLEADKIIGVGTTSQESVATNFEIGTTFFANPQGVYAYSGNRPKLISRKIQKYVDAVTTASWIYAAGGVDEDHYYLSVGNITVNSRLISNAVFVYHFNLDAWTIHSMAIEPNVFAAIGLTYPNKPLSFGSVSGTYTITDSTSDLVGAGVRSINTEVLTKEYMLVFPEKTTLENIDVVAIQGGDTRISYQLDRNLTGKEGDFVSLKGGLNKRVNTFRVGKDMNTVRVRMTDNSLRTSIIEGFNLEYTAKKVR